MTPLALLSAFGYSVGFGGLLGTLVVLFNSWRP